MPKKKTKKPTQFICKICNNDFERFVYPASRNTFEYCSIICRNKGISKNNISRKNSERLYLQTCPICNKQGRRKQSYCNKHFNRKVIWDKNKTNYLKRYYSTDGAKSIAKKLNLTHKQVLMKANSLKLTLNKKTSFRIVHSKARDHMLKNNPMHNSKTINKVKQFYIDNPDKRKVLMEKLTIGKAKHQRNKPTKLEIKMFDILENIGVKYHPFFIIKKKFIVDCKIDNLIMQADGEYWHGHPRFEPLTDRQKTQQKRDNAQDKYLTTCGYIIERIWEHSMSEQAIRNILSKHNII